MLVGGHLTLPIAPPAAPPPARIDNAEAVTRSVVLTPLKEPSSTALSAPLKNPDPQQPELRQIQRPVGGAPGTASREETENSAGPSEASAENIEPPVQGAEQQAGRDGERDAESSARERPSAPEEPGLDDVDLEQVRELSARDREVRAHEQAHASVGGSLAGAASFSYARGPDGRQYAVGGEVSIDTTPVPNNPEATIRKAQQIRRAAQAPANPSAQDRQVAARAIQMEIEARLELARERREQVQQDPRSRAAIDMYRELTRIGRSLDEFPDLEQVIDARA